MDDSRIALRRRDEDAPSADMWSEPLTGLEQGARHDPVVAELAASRQRLGLTLGQVAERSGLSEASLASWERGDAMPPLDALRRWAAGLGMALELVRSSEPACSGYRIEWRSRRLSVRGKPVRLTRMEWNILERLASAPGQLVTHRELFRHLYGEEREDRAQATAIRVRISKLRQKVPFRIEARWGQGYVIEGVETPDHPPSAPQGGGDDAEPQPQEPRQVASSREPRGRNPAYKASALPFVARPEPAHRGTVAAQALRMAEPVKRMMPPPPMPTASAIRAAELGVIERFLAERGATRCPDPRMLAQTAAPGLVWDKIKRKWVRPVADACALGLTQ